MPLLGPGESLPAFDLPRGGGGRLSDADLRGRPVALFVYPGDATPSCTREAQDFTALAPGFAAAGVPVLGLSGGTAAAKDRFARKAALAVPLLADEGRTLIQALGAWGPKTMYGRTSDGILRASFLFDAGGLLVRAWEVARVAGHAAEVLEAARALRPP